MFFRRLNSYFLSLFEETAFSLVSGRGFRYNEISRKPARITPGAPFFISNTSSEGDEWTMRKDQNAEKQIDAQVEALLNNRKEG